MEEADTAVVLLKHLERSCWYGWSAAAAAAENPNHRRQIQTFFHCRLSVPQVLWVRIQFPRYWLLLYTSIKPL